MSDAGEFIARRKATLRKELRARLAALDRDERARRSREATARVETLPEWTAAERLLLFRSLPSEIDTASLFESALRLGRAVYAPRIEGDELRFCRVTDATPWRRGSFFALEPESGDPVLARELSPDSAVVLVPGLAFSPRGERLGRGGGHYDRALSTPPLAGRVRTIGLAFDFQIVPEVPTEAHDVRVEAVITDARVLRAAEEGSSA